MQKNKTIYSRIVGLKKRFIKTRIVPQKIALVIDAFFNNFHNIIIQTRDTARDILIKSKDVTRDAIIRSTDVTRDALIRSKDVTIDSIIKSKEITEKAIESSRSGSGAKYYLVYPFMLLYNICVALYLSIKLLPYAITEESDQKAVGHIDKIIVNSWNVKERVEKFYGRESEVVYPPIETSKLSFKGDSGYWLSVNRLTPDKRVHMQVEAFKKMPSERLIVVGGSDNNNREYVTQLKDECSYNIQLLGSISDRELVELYSYCRGLVTTSVDEDFGMAAVEAFASGKPVIAPNEGGYKETLINNETGKLIDGITPEKIIRAVREINEELGKNAEKYKSKCRQRAKEFDVEIFLGKISKSLKANGR